MRRIGYKYSEIAGFTAVAITALSLIGSASGKADDILVIPSTKSVLSIYSYGGAAPIRNNPELPERKSNLGAFATPAPVTPYSPQPASVSGSKHETSATAAAPGSSNGGATSSVDPAPSSPVTSGDLSLTRFVTLTWDPSPDDSVVGYQLYIGVVSQQYKSKRTLGNQTSVQILVTEPVMYFTLSAYTGDGLESVTAKLMVVTNPPSNDGPSQSRIADPNHVGSF